MNAMSMLSIHDFATSRSGPVAIAVDRDGRAHVIDLNAQFITHYFDVCWDNGGKRVAVSDDGHCCVTGAYGKRGLVCYSADSGAVRWARRDVRRVQALEYIGRMRACMVMMDRARSHLVELATGATLMTFPPMRYLCASQHDELWCVDDGALRIVEEGRYTVRTPIVRESIAVLAAAFSRTRLFLSESAGALRAIDIKSGELLWRLDIAKQHYVELTHAEYEGLLYGVRWAYASGGETFLDAIAAETGELCQTHSLGIAGTGGRFVNSGERLLRFSGEVIDTKTGKALFSI